MGSRIAHALSIDTKIDDLVWPWPAITSNSLEITGDFSHIQESTTAKRMKNVSDCIVAH